MKLRQAFARATFALVAGIGSLTASVGSATLIGTVDYSDTFTLNDSLRPSGTYNTNDGAYNVENCNGNTAAAWTPTSYFSFSNAASATGYGYSSSATGNDGATTGLALSGSSACFSFTYGVTRSNFVVQVDAYKNGGRVDICSLATAGDQPSSASNSLAVTFENSGTINLVNASGTTATTFTTGISTTDANWHNYAVNFNKGANAVSIYVDQTLKGTVDLTTFASGIYQTYSSNAVGTGGVAWPPLMLDNFQVGNAIPEPTSFLMMITGLIGLLAYAWRKRK